MQQDRIHARPHYVRLHLLCASDVDHQVGFLRSLSDSGLVSENISTGYTLRQ